LHVAIKSLGTNYTRNYDDIRSDAIGKFIFGQNGGSFSVA